MLVWSFQLVRAELNERVKRVWRSSNSASEKSFFSSHAQTVPGQATSPRLRPTM